MPPYTGQGYARLGITAEGDFVEVQRGNTPKGGLTAKRAKLEYEMMKRFRHADYPVGWGRYGLEFEGEQLGLVIAGMREEDERVDLNFRGNFLDIRNLRTDESIKLGIGIAGIPEMEDNERRELYTDIFRKIGQALREYHGLGYVHKFPYAGNIGVEYDQREYRIILRDLDTTVDLSKVEGDTMQKARYRFLDVSRVIYDLSVVGKKMEDGGLLEFSWLIGPFLEGYFYDIDKGSDGFKRLQEEAEDNEFANTIIHIGEGIVSIGLNTQESIRIVRVSSTNTNTGERYINESETRNPFAQVMKNLLAIAGPTAEMIGPTTGQAPTADAGAAATDYSQEGASITEGDRNRLLSAIMESGVDNTKVKEALQLLRDAGMMGEDEDIGENAIISEEYVKTHSVVEIAIAIVHEQAASKERQWQERIWGTSIGNRQHIAGIAAEVEFLTELGRKNIQAHSEEASDRLHDALRRYDEVEKALAGREVDYTQKDETALSVQEETQPTALPIAELTVPVIEPVTPAAVTAVPMIEPVAPTPKPAVVVEPTIERVPLPIDRTLEYLEAVYGVIVRAPVLDMANGEVAQDRGMLGAIGNGMKKKAKYVAIMKTENIAPLIRNGMRAEGMVDENLMTASIRGAVRLLEANGIESLLVIEADGIEELREALQDRGATADNTFIYCDNATDGARTKDITSDSYFGNYMLANINVHGRDEFISVGGLLALSVWAMNVRSGAKPDLNHLYDLLAAMESSNPDAEHIAARRSAIETYWVAKGWAEDPMKAFTSGYLEINAVPIDVNRDLRDYYRREAEFQRVL
ncbi:MAG: hypothetical protein HQ575_04610 [Candidatus Omnitrophica bacterium]|nr:hypothetical protein [Candidatus Omnitrophota bacterium]